MRAGQLRHRVTIQSRTDAPDATTGAPTTTWTDVATVSAAVEPLRGREYFDARSNNSEVDVRIRMRHRAGITSAMRVKFGTRLFDIQGPPINVEERGRELHLMCKEYTDGR